MLILLISKDRAEYDAIDSAFIVADSSTVDSDSSFVSTSTRFIVKIV